MTLHRLTTNAILAVAHAETIAISLQNGAEVTMAWSIERMRVGIRLVELYGTLQRARLVGDADRMRAVLLKHRDSHVEPLIDGTATLRQIATLRGALELAAEVFVVTEALGLADTERPEPMMEACGGE
jgi:hypothetical protein